MNMCVCAHVCVCVCVACGGQKKESGPPEREFQVILGYLCECLELNSGPLGELFIGDSSLQPLLKGFK